MRDPGPVDDRAGARTPAVSVVVAARDAAGTLRATLDGLARQTATVPFEVVVVDDGSRDGTADLADGHPVGPRLVRRPSPGEGPGDARNAGVAVARAPVLAFTDADCVPTPEWLQEGLAALERTGAGIVQGAVRPRPADTAGPFGRTLWVPAEYGLYETANLFVLREWFDRVGGFEDWVNRSWRPGGAPDGPQRHFGEDALFAWRARRLGARTAFSERALVHHAVFPRDPLEFVLERRRDGLFAELVALIPELRERMLFGRVFLGRRAAAFHLAAAGGAVAVAGRRPVWLLAGTPWALMLVAEARRRGGRGRVALVLAAGDAVGAASLVRGSVRARTLVL